MEKLYNFFRTKTVIRALDVGTGSGNFLPVIKNCFPDAQLSAIDPNTESLKEASGKFTDVSFFKMEAENIEFGNNTFDALSVSMALHHIADVDKALNEMQRVVKPGGWIIVNELYSDNLSPAQKVHRLYHHFRSTIDRLIGVSHNFTFKRQEIIDLVNHSGIDLIEVFDNQDNSIKNDPEKIEERVSKMKANLVQIEGKPEYTSLKPQIEEFRQKAIKFGIQTAPRLVIIGKVK